MRSANPMLTIRPKSSNCRRWKSSIIYLLMLPGRIQSRLKRSHTRWDFIANLSNSSSALKISLTSWGFLKRFRRQRNLLLQLWPKSYPKQLCLKHQRLQLNGERLNNKQRDKRIYLSWTVDLWLRRHKNLQEGDHSTEKIYLRAS